jgi:hypothetical protein
VLFANNIKLCKRCNYAFLLVERQTERFAFDPLFHFHNLLKQSLANSGKQKSTKLKVSCFLIGCGE